MQALKLLTQPSAPYRCPKSLKGTPHVALRDRFFRVLTDASGTAGSTGRGLACFGCFGTLEETLVNTTFGFHQGELLAGNPRNVFQQDLKYSSQVIPDGTVCRGRLASLHVRIQASVPSTGFLPTGFVHVGSYGQVIDFASFATATALCDHIVNRGDTRVYTAAQALQGIDLVLVPNDLLSNAAMKLLGNSVPVGTPVYPYDGWGNICIVAQSTTSTTSYLLTVHARWSVEYTRDLTLQSLHVHHESYSDEAMQEAKKVLNDAAGMAGELGVGAAGAAAWNAAGRIMGRMGPRIVPGIAAGAAEALPLLALSKAPSQTRTGVQGARRKSAVRPKPRARPRKLPARRKGGKR